MTQDSGGTTISRAGGGSGPQAGRGSPQAGDAPPQRAGLLLRLWRTPRPLAAATFLMVLVIAALAADVYPHGPREQNLGLVLQPPSLTAYETVTGERVFHPLGTDALGRDLLARILHGARISLFIGLGAMLLAAVVGSILGLMAGYLGGWIDSAVTSMIDALLSLPFIILAIAIIGVLGPSLFNIVLVLGLTGWVTFARLVRGRVLELKEEPFVEAVRAAGGSHVRIMLRHLLPNVSSLIIVDGTLQVGGMILAEAGLSFLGLGVQPPTPTWGGIVNEGQVYIYTAWWISTVPGLLLMMTVLSVNFVGDFLRDQLDPESRGQG